MQDDGTDGQQPYLRLAVHGHAWLTCQRCMTPYDQTFDVDMTYRIVATEEEAEEFPLDDDEADVIVGSRQFDLVDLIEEELLLRCRSCQARGLPGSSRKPRVGRERSHGRDGRGVRRSRDEGKRPNPFAALEALKKDGDGTKKH
ncbi:DUF177 domain-containing protein [Burkholderia cenocepacia]|uniref:DUF177 domain-containing protein n=1 Tax=Burkholderia cenocepacia TaxID=95486 RepID=UPI0015814718|nr:DUF177 domain-containing protein [Burkholderia cenocepacia]QKT97209.1 DUF177 domain-containing protein [Burkholderia cenocepacia]